MMDKSDNAINVGKYINYIRVCLQLIMCVLIVSIFYKLGVRSIGTNSRGSMYNLSGLNDMLSLYNLYIIYCFINYTYKYVASFEKWFTTVILRCINRESIKDYMTLKCIITHFEDEPKSYLISTSVGMLLLNSAVCILIALSTNFSLVISYAVYTLIFGVLTAVLIYTHYVNRNTRKIKQEGIVIDMTSRLIKIEDTETV